MCGTPPGPVHFEPYNCYAATKVEVHCGVFEGYTEFSRVPLLSM